MEHKFKILHLRILPEFPFMGLISVMMVGLIWNHNLRYVSAIPAETQALAEGSQLKSNITSLTTSSVTEDTLNKIFPSNIPTKTINSTKVSEDPEEILRKALINHTLTHGGEGDLDKLIFSSIPEGSKLVLRTVKVIRTDEDGNPVKGSESKEEPLHWDVSLTNSTDIADEYEDESDESQEEGNTTNRSPTENDKVDTDLVIAGSHAQANYNAYGTGSSEKQKGKNQKYYHGNDHGKTHKVTDTDTDGLKVTNYKGKEDGVTDFANSHGDSQKKDSERFRDTKRKNKGRRVSGFKRVYHKEEFQRTEHFFDDEEAKRIAESYGLKDSKEQSNHGKNDDDRKYHGVHKEHTDGKKVKNEHGTSNGYNKGQLTEYKESEKHKHRSHYDKSQHSPQTNKGYYQQQQHYHPNHNYHGSYSHPRNTVRHPNSATNTNNNLMVSTHDIIGTLAKAPMIASFTVTPYEQDSSTDSSTDGPAVLSPSRGYKHRRPQDSPLTLHKPDEMRTFFSPRERSSPALPEYSESPAYPHNLKEGHTRGEKQYHPKYRINNNIRAGYSSNTFRNKIGNASLDDDGHRKNYTNYYRNINGSYDRERYARNYPSSTVRNSLLGGPPGPGTSGFSTLVKVLPVKYINLTDNQSGHVNEDSRQQSVNTNHIVSSPQSRQNRTNYRNPNAITFTTNVPNRTRRPPPRSKWISITIGDPDVLNDEPQHPNHNYAGPPSTGIRPLSSIVRGVKDKLMQIAYPSIPYRSVNQFDPSKYPPNVVQSNGNPPSNLAHSTSTQNVNYNSNPHLNAQQRPSSGMVSGYRTHYNRNRNPPFPLQGGHNRPRTPDVLPPFMNNLMDSVANFFNRISNKE